MKEIVYISGPMSGYTDYNKAEFNRVANIMLSEGYEVINPVELDSIPLGKDNPQWKDYIMRDIKVLYDRNITMLILLDNWEDSKGSRAEVYIAKEVLGCRIKKFTTKDDKWFLADIDVSIVSNNLEKKYFYLKIKDLVTGDYSNTLVPDKDFINFLKTLPDLHYIENITNLMLTEEQAYYF